MTLENISEITIAGTVEDSDEHFHKEIIEIASEYDFPEVFDSQIRNVSEDRTESILIYADRIPREPSAAQPDNLFLIDPQGDEWILRAEFEEPYLDHFLGLFDDLLDDIELSIDDLTVISIFDRGFDTIDAEIDVPDEFSTSGIQVVHESISHTIQSSDQVESAIQESSDEILEEYEDDEVCIVVSVATERITATDNTFLQENLEQVEETLSQVFPQEDG